MKLSVIIPIYNAAASIAELVHQLKIVLRDISHEIIMVNDGSTDATDGIAKQLAQSTPGVKLISLRKNFGEHNAVLCGLNFSEGDYSVIIDDDFQNPPEEIRKLLAEIEEGAWDVVYSKYDSKRHRFWRNAGSWLHNKIANFLMPKPKDLYLSSFKIISREIVSEIIKYKGPYPYIDGLILRVTSNIGSIKVRHSFRRNGHSNYTLKKLLRLHMNMFINFSVKPLRMFTVMGILVFLSGFTLAVYFTLTRYLVGEIPGWTSTVVFILLFSGFQAVFLGLVGEYIGKLYLDQNKTPQWAIKRMVEHAEKISA